MGMSTRPAAGKSRRHRRGSHSPMSEINVTPFVDVMLVLLIIFMVAAPLLTVGVPLDLPKTQAQSLPSENEPPLTVNLDGEGRVYIQKTEVPPEELIVRLAAEFCIPLTDSTSRSEVLTRLAESGFQQAKIIDGQQESSVHLEDFSLVEARS